MSLGIRDFDYDTAARTYDAHRQGRGPYFDTLLSLALAAPAGPALEVGAGTGNNSVPFLAESGRELVALEPSAGMLATGRRKVSDACWARGRIEALPFASGTFSVVYGTYMLHHVPSLERAFRECHRCLGKGVAAFVTVSEGFIARHPMNAYFPSFAKVDHARFQPIGAVRAALEHAGFSRVAAVETQSPPRRVDDGYADKIAAKFISTYALLPEAELTAGVARLRQDIAEAGGALAQPLVREAVVVYGWKS